MLLLTAIIMLIASAFSLNETMDIHLYDTYYVVSAAYAFWSIAVLLMILWLVYLFTNRFLFSRMLMWLHVVLTVVISVFLAIFIANFGKLAGMPRRYIDDGFNAFAQFQQSILVSVFLLVLGMALYVINLLIGLVRRKQP